MGLGNPGPEYEGTRHNAGFWAIDALSARHSIPLSDRRRTCALGKGAADGHRVVLAKPRTYVNESGLAARYLLDRFKVGPERLLVVYDDMDLPPGKLRLKTGGGPGGHNGVWSCVAAGGGRGVPRLRGGGGGGGGPGGHNGMKSIVAAVGDRGFPRLRIGVGRPGSGGDDIDHVLGPPAQPERRLIDQGVACVSEIVAGIFTDGMDRTMDWVNRGLAQTPD